MFAPASFFVRRTRSCSFLLKLGVLWSVAGSAFSVPAALDVRDAALRAPRAGFTATVVSMTVVSREPARLVGVSTSVAHAVELHQVVREGSEVRMEPVPSIPLPAGREVWLELGETKFHLMVMQLKRPLRSGERVSIRLLVEDERTHQRQTIQVPVRVVGRAAQSNDEDHLH